MTSTVLRNAGQVFCRTCPVGICFSHHQNRVTGLGEESHGGEVPFSSLHVKDTHPTVWLATVHTGLGCLAEVSPGFSTGALLYLSAFYSVLVGRKSLCTASAVVLGRHPSTSLSIEYLHNYLEFCLGGLSVLSHFNIYSVVYPVIIFWVISQDYSQNFVFHFILVLAIRSSFHWHHCSRSLCFCLWALLI